MISIDGEADFQGSRASEDCQSEIQGIGDDQEQHLNQEKEMRCLIGRCLNWERSVGQLDFQGKAGTIESHSGRMEIFDQIPHYGGWVQKTVQMGPRVRKV